MERDMSALTDVDTRFEHNDSSTGYQRRLNGADRAHLYSESGHDHAKRRN